MSKKRKGMLGKLINKLMLWVGKTISDRLLKTNDIILPTMQFDLKTPLKADLSIIQFINHLERQKPLTWESWLLVRSREREEEVREEREKREKWRDELVND
jgi:protein tyrosine/serine phosphatase